MRILKGIVFLCFVLIIVLAFLTHIQLPEGEGYELEVNSTFPFYSGWAPLDVVTLSFYYLLTAPRISSGLLTFVCFVLIGAASYVGFIFGLPVAIVERRKKEDFMFILSFTNCLFFAVFMTVIAVLI